jgi:hypothetical protein
LALGVWRIASSLRQQSFLAKPAAKRIPIPDPMF